MLDLEFKEWNDAVWHEKWLISKDSPCHLCGQQGTGISSRESTLCLECLNEFPMVPWHPTGTVRPKVKDLLQHATTCDRHLIPSEPS